MSFFVGAKTYYIATTGSDTNSGTITAPFKTVAKAHSLVVAGDIILVRGGTYVTPAIKLTKSGTSVNRISLWAYPGEKPVLVGSSITVNATWVITLSNNASWWHIKGFEIKNNAWGGGIFMRNCSNNIIENNNIHHNGNLSDWAATGISVYGTSSNNLILNNDSHHNMDKDCGDADGIDMGVTGSGNVIRGNRVWQNSDDGIDLFNTNDNTVGGRVLVENNWAWLNGYNSSLVACGNGMGIKLGGARNANTVSGGHKVRNNVTWKNFSGGFDDNNSGISGPVARPDTLYNNTSWQNVTDGNYVFYAPSLHVFRNNLSVGILGQTNGSFTTNSWSLPVTANNSDFVSISDVCAIGPRQADGSLPVCTFLRLIQGSDLIDKGVNVGIPFLGVSPDLGAFEFSNTSPIANRSDNEENNYQYTIYPNPATSFINVKCNNLHDTQFKIINSMGVEVLNTKINGDENIIDVSELNNGIYFGVMEGETKVIKLMIIK